MTDGSLRGEIFVRANLEGAHLRDAVLQGGSLRYAQLHDVDLSGADLRGVAFLEADLSGANLTRARLQRAEPRYADLQGAVLRMADLRDAKMFAVSLQGADLSGARLEGADTREARFDRRTVMPDGTRWTPETDSARFTDPEHPSFWQPTEPLPVTVKAPPP
ncbi:MAG: pentapeptide repeat-containing protein [Vicinamibacteria bacterium]|nr:pentapeptide repeat-containing protein [Vicinamibacteria bacterium]